MKISFDSLKPNATFALGARRYRVVRVTAFSVYFHEIKRLGARKITGLTRQAFEFAVSLF